jgi:hypothetical protein
MERVLPVDKKVGGVTERERKMKKKKRRRRRGGECV